MQKEILELIRLLATKLMELPKDSMTENIREGVCRLVKVSCINDFYDICEELSKLFQNELGQKFGRVEVVEELVLILKKYDKKNENIKNLKYFKIANT